ncbi:hypothetical protein ACQKWADRAFT_28468 [Trichoderma austrokoningii]
MIFYMIMALGATNAANTVQQFRTQSDQKIVGLIQVFVLIAIYLPYGSVGSSQWQLAGFAMRMAVETGLHCTLETNNASEGASDQRNRIFSTIYTIDTSLAYNLGRPPSIGEKHIASALTKESVTSLHYIRHRQIQNRIIAQVYGINSTTRNMSIEKKQLLVLDLQKELNEWQLNIPVDSRDNVSYPYRFAMLTSLDMLCVR